MIDPGRGSGAGTGHRAEAAGLMLKIDFLAFTRATGPALSMADLAGLAESPVLESAAIESPWVALSGMEAGGTVLAIRMGRGTQSGGSVSQSWIRVSAVTVSADPDWALPHPVRAVVRNAATMVERNDPVKAEPGMS